jgi:FixJ family two-component response regulator
VRLFRAAGERTHLRQLRAHYAQLTARQRQVLSLVLKGRLNKRIAAELGLSENTVKVHRRHIMKIMRAPSLCAPLAESSPSPVLACSLMP